MPWKLLIRVGTDCLSSAHFLQNVQPNILWDVFEFCFFINSYVENKTCEILIGKGWRSTQAPIVGTLVLHIVRAGRANYGSTTLLSAFLYYLQRDFWPSSAKKKLAIFGI